MGESRLGGTNQLLIFSFYCSSVFFWGQTHRSAPTLRLPVCCRCAPACAPFFCLWLFFLKLLFFLKSPSRLSPHSSSVRGGGPLAVEELRFLLRVSFKLPPKFTGKFLVPLREGQLFFLSFFFWGQTHRSAPTLRLPVCCRCAPACAPFFLFLVVFS